MARGVGGGDGVEQSPGVVSKGVDIGGQSEGICGKGTEAEAVLEVNEEG